MLVSMNWIKDFVDLSGEDLNELIGRFTLSTAEVEDVYYKGTGVKGVIAAEIVSVENHPDSKKLHLLKVNTGNEVLDVVCGAPDVEAGKHVAFAPVGSTVVAGEISAAKIAGYVSYGMCCGADELGLSDEHTGLMQIDDDIPLGTDLKSVYPIDDVVFEVDNKSLTNRPDLWGHYGIAREFAALTGKPLKKLEVASTESDSEKETPVSTGRPDLLYRYSCLEMSGITKKISPVSMRIRLYYCGMRGINLLADLTNYIMLEIGQPTHAFDARKISSIRVDTPTDGYQFKTLDGNEREITPETLMILNGDEPVAIAGVMGGLDSEIVNDTNSVLLESANFDAVSVRKTSSRLGLRTDASIRYEKTLDPELTLIAVGRFVKLLKDIDAGAYISSKLTDYYVNHYPDRVIKFDKSYVDRYTGIDISSDRIEETLNLLGFGVKRANDSFEVKVPSWRATKDVTIPADIIEEITRIYGYDNFEIKTTDSLLKPVRASAGRTDSYAIKNILVQRFGLHEVHSYIWQDGRKYSKLGIDVAENVRILNMTTPENGTLRRSMIPTMLTFVNENKGFSPDFGVFEAGRVVNGLKNDGTCDERRQLGISLFSKTCDEKTLFFRMTDIIRTLFSEIKNGEPEFRHSAPVYEWQHPRNTVSIVFGEITVGTVCTLHPSVLSKLDKNGASVSAEISLDAFSSIGENDLHYSEPSRFPSVDIDLSILLNDGKTYADASETWQDFVPSPISSVMVIDTFEPVTGGKSVTVRLTFSSDERTLSMEDDVQPVTDKIIKSLSEKGITIR